MWIIVFFIQLTFSSEIKIKINYSHLAVLINKCSENFYQLILLLTLINVDFSELEAQFCMRSCSVMYPRVIPSCRCDCSCWPCNYGETWANWALSCRSSSISGKIIKSLSVGQTFAGMLCGQRVDHLSM